MYYFKPIAVIVIATIFLIYASFPVSAQEHATVAVSSSASSAVLYEPTSGQVLFEKNAHQTRPMASTTKLMTALIACERLPADTVLTATSQALAVEGSSMGLRVGDTITRDDLLYGLLLSSGNDAANVLALSVAGSFEAFAALMNERAAAIGMTHSHFVTPSGLDADGHGASAYDMALLAAEVLRNDTLATICATATKLITIGDRTVTLQNHNKLLSRYDGAVGMKTGYTSLAGRCLVSAATRDGVTLIAVTLDCANDWEEHETMLDEGFALTCQLTLTPPSLPKLSVFGGNVGSVTLGATTTTVTVLRSCAEDVQTVVKLPSYLWAPFQAKKTVGEISYYLHGSCIASVAVTTVEAVFQQPPRSHLWRIKTMFIALLCEAVT